MFSLHSLSARNINSIAVAALSTLGFAIAFGATSAQAAPLHYPFAPQVQQAPQMDDEGSAAELPARFKRQVVAYAGAEAAGTVIIDTPNTYLYYVLGGGRAIRYTTVRKPAAHAST